jgi:hypothetical protein
MGAGASVRRYKGGKRPEKYFIEDQWPLVEDMLTKLGFNRETGFVLFRLFADIDVDEGGSCDLDETFGFLGGKRSKYNERVFELKGANNPKDGLEFLPWSIALWNFSTFSSQMIARSLWEVFDSDGGGELTKHHVDAMFRMMYDLDHSEPKIMDAFPCEKKEPFKISKLAFLNHIAWDKRIIKPGLNFQKRVRKKLGGNEMWNKLASYRKRCFGMYDEHAPTLEISLAQIVAASNPNRKVAPADLKLAQEKVKLKREMEEAARELREKERREHIERRRQELLAEDRPMKLAWGNLDTSMIAFEENPWSIEDIEERKAARLHLFDLCDKAIEETKKYWSMRDEKDRKQLEVGTDEDNTARYKDYLSTLQGKHERDTLVLIRSLKHLIEKYPGHHKMGGKETTRLSAISECQHSVERIHTIHLKQRAEYERKQNNYASLIEEKVDIDKKVDPDLEVVVHEMDLSAYFKTVKSYIERKELAKIEKEIDNELTITVRERESQSNEWEIARGTEERRRMFIRRDFQITTKFGSRITKWEYVFDPHSMRNVFVNNETFDVLHEKTAICERCDTVFAQADVKCQECDAARSAKNLKLFRPLGFKDITME